MQTKITVEYHLTRLISDFFKNKNAQFWQSVVTRQTDIFFSKTHQMFIPFNPVIRLSSFHPKRIILRIKKSYKYKMFIAGLFIILNKSENNLNTSKMIKCVNT